MPIKLGTTKFKIPYSKAYIGSQLIHQASYVVETEFTSNVFPSEWAEVTAGTEYTGVNDYGTWRITATKHFGSNGINNAFDGDSSTQWNGGMKYDNISFDEGIIECPAEVEIQLSKIYLKYDDQGNTSNPSRLQGYNTITGEWEDIHTLTVTGAVVEETIDITSKNYYSKFKLVSYRNSANVSTGKLYEFQALSGIIKHISSSPIIPDILLPDSAILLFPFDVDGYDVIVGSKKITYTSLSSEVAKFAKAAYRDSGYDTYLSVSDLSGNSLHLSQISGGTKNLTLESWVKITSANAIILRYGGTNETYMQGLAIYSNSTGFELKWLISANVVKSTVTANIGTTPQDNWHHLAISVNNKIASFFVDGKKYGEIDISGYNTNHNYLGIGSTKGTYYDELLVCNDSLYTSDFAPPTGPYVLK
jgi:hypothetical protein